MSEFLIHHYLTLKALHLIFVISWMAGLLYLPRLYVYHTQVVAGSEASEKFKVMEQRLLRIIINPAGILVIVSGIFLIMALTAGGPGIGGWFHAKILLVLILGALHGSMAKFRKEFERDERRRSEKFYRILNEGPTLLMVVIVFLAVVKPF
jgi:putative membrane protein